MFNRALGEGVLVLLVFRSCHTVPHCGPHCHTTTLPPVGALPSVGALPHCHSVTRASWRARRCPCTAQCTVHSVTRVYTATACTQAVGIPALLCVRLHTRASTPAKGAGSAPRGKVGCSAGRHGHVGGASSWAALLRSVVRREQRRYWSWYHGPWRRRHQRQRRQRHRG